MSKQTAVKWFFSELERMQYFIGNDMLEAYKQAKEMEKEQIIESYDEAESKVIGNGEKYYNKTFKK